MILAVTFGIFALLGLVCQPWLLLLLLIPNGYWFAPFLGTVTTFLVYDRLNHIGLLEGPKRYFEASRRSQWGNIGATLFILIVVIISARMHDLPALNRQAPDTATDVAESLHLQENCSFCIYDDDNYSVWIWRTRVTRSQLPKVVAAMQLSPIDVKTLSDDFRNKAPYWWRLPVLNRSLAYSTDDPGKEIHGKGRHILATWDTDSEMMYLQIIVIGSNRYSHPSPIFPPTFPRT